MKKQLLSRRRFTAQCATIGVSLPALRIANAFGQGAKSAARSVKFANGVAVPAVGQGCWHLGQDRHPPDVEEAALRAGISLGMTLIDTSGNYGGGRSEQFIGKSLAAERERIFLVSKVEGNQVAGDGVAQACDASLSRLGTDHLDLYLLHWPIPTDQFGAVVAAFEKLRSVGKIRAWGVSNFDTAQMEDLFRVADGHRCATNQVPYSLKNRKIESDLLPWCAKHKMPVMAYSPLGGDNNLVVHDPVLADIGAAHGCSAAAVALAWVVRSGQVIAIPESGTPEHTRENAVGLSLQLTASELQKLASSYA